MDNSTPLFCTVPKLALIEAKPVSAGKALSYKRSVVNLLYPVKETSNLLSKKAASKPRSILDIYWRN